MYEWEMNSANMQKFKSGMVVNLNPDWTQYSYLKNEFGEMFPLMVESVDGDVVRLKLGEKSVEFAHQTLTRLTPKKH